MPEFYIRTTETRWIGRTYLVEADTAEEALAKYEAGEEDFDNWESDDGDCIDSQVTEIEQL